MLHSQNSNSQEYPVTQGNRVTLAQGENLAGVPHYIRVRYHAIDTPLGATQQYVCKTMTVCDVGRNILRNLVHCTRRILKWRRQFSEVTKNHGHPRKEGEEF